MMKKKAIKNILSVTLNIIIYFFLLISLLFAIFSILSKKDEDGAVNIFGYEVRRVVTDSMEECEYTDVSAFDIKSIAVNSMIFIRRVPSGEDLDYWYSSIKIGDVLTFKYLYGRQITITHRVINITKKANGGYIIELAGDNRDSSFAYSKQIIDTSLADSPDYVIGKVVGQSIFLGKIATYLSNQLTMFLCVIMPCFGIIMYQIFKIMYSKVVDELYKKEEEIKLLKKQLDSIKQ